ncbi:MAG: hypothetical protein OSJ36_09745 [Odoribacter sp.]|nr:hypothetical protein [Odoribacter sp.]
MEDCREMQAVLSNTTAVDAELKTVTDEFMVVREMLKKMVEDNSRKVQDQDEFWAEYNPLDERAKKADARIQELMAQRTQRMQKAETIGAFMFEMHERDEAVEEFNNKLWFMTVDKVVVQKDGKLVYSFRNGMQVEV